MNDIKEKSEIRYISGEMNKEDFEGMFSKILAIFNLKEDQTRVICSAKAEVSEVSLVKLAQLCDASIELDYMKKKVTFYYMVNVITDKKTEIKEAVEETSAFNDSDPGDLPF